MTEELNTGEMQSVRIGGQPDTGRLEPSASHTFADAIEALGRCQDVARAAGCSIASTYIGGAGGNLRRALAALGCIGPLAEPAARQSFEVERAGASELIGSSGRFDTIRNCRMPDGTLGTARALLTADDPTRGVWLREDGRLPALVVRGRVSRDDRGFAFADGLGEARPRPAVAGPDLGRDLIGSRCGIDVGSYEAAAAWEMSLVGGCWVHLATGARWYADHASARALVRLLGGVPVLGREALLRVGARVDDDVLSLVEALGWRHWQTPGL